VTFWQLVWSDYEASLPEPRWKSLVFARTSLRPA
jgi:hypothetical protein